MAEEKTEREYEPLFPMESSTALGLRLECAIAMLADKTGIPIRYLYKALEDIVIYDLLRSGEFNEKEVGELFRQHKKTIRSRYIDLRDLKSQYHQYFNLVKMARVLYQSARHSRDSDLFRYSRYWSAIARIEDDFFLEKAD